MSPNRQSKALLPVQNDSATPLRDLNPCNHLERVCGPGFRDHSTSLTSVAQRSDLGMCRSFRRGLAKPNVSASVSVDWNPPDSTPRGHASPLATRLRGEVDNRLQVENPIHHKLVDIWLKEQDLCRMASKDTQLDPLGERSACCVLTSVSVEVAKDREPLEHVGVRRQRITHLSRVAGGNGTK